MLLTENLILLLYLYKKRINIHFVDFMVLFFFIFSNN